MSPDQVQVLTENYLQPQTLLVALLCGVLRYACYCDYYHRRKLPRPHVCIKCTKLRS